MMKNVCEDGEVLGWWCVHMVMSSTCGREMTGKESIAVEVRPS